MKPARTKPATYCSLAGLEPELIVARLRCPDAGGIILPLLRVANNWAYENFVNTPSRIRTGDLLRERQAS
jgi:hypothetical protein